jgi:hypothetical protein
MRGSAERRCGWPRVDTSPMTVLNGAHSSSAALGLSSTVIVKLLGSRVAGQFE